MRCLGFSQSWAPSPHLLLLQVSHSGVLSLSLLNMGVTEAVERVTGNQTDALALTQGGIQQSAARLLGPRYCPASTVRCSVGAPRWAVTPSVLTRGLREARGLHGAGKMPEGDRWAPVDTGTWAGRAETLRSPRNLVRLLNQTS